MTHSPVYSEKVAPPIGPYAQGVRHGNMVFVSGQIAVNNDGVVVGEGDIELQTRKVLDNLQAILNAAGGSLADVVKVTIYLKTMKDYAAMNKVYGSYFAHNPPARATVQAELAKETLLVEMDAIAILQ